MARRCANRCETLARCTGSGCLDAYHFAHGSYPPTCVGGGGATNGPDCLAAGGDWVHRVADAATSPTNFSHANVVGTHACMRLHPEAFGAARVRPSLYLVPAPVTFAPERIGPEPFYADYRDCAHGCTGPLHVDSAFEPPAAGGPVEAGLFAGCPADRPFYYSGDHACAAHR